MQAATHKILIYLNRHKMRCANLASGKQVVLCKLASCGRFEEVASLFQWASLLTGKLRQAYLEGGVTKKFHPKTHFPYCQRVYSVDKVDSTYCPIDI